MSSKIYTKQSVYEATQTRLQKIFDNFNHVLIAVSGGKDSGVLFNLAYDYAKQTNQVSKLAIYFLDYEAQYKMTIEYVHDLFEKHPDIERYWLCLPNMVPSATSMTTGYWLPWDKAKQDMWVRQMPSDAYVYSQDNMPYAYLPGTDDYKAQEDFTKWYSTSHGKTAVLIGIRADESMDRYRTIKSKNKVNGYLDTNYMITKDSNTVNAYPIYDWKTTDIWIANGKFGYDYNELYDVYYRAGIKLDDMRVASPFLEQGLSTLKYYQVIEPDTWAKMLGRVNGVNFSGIYGGTTLMGWKNIKLPKGHTWKSYVKFLLSTLPEDTRKDYEKIFATSIEFWKNRGGVIDEDTIQDLRDAGIPFRLNGKTNYKTDKQSVIFEQYPDDADVKNFRVVPSYKRMAITIMKNDHTAKYMGFSRTKDQQEKRKKAIEKYQNIL